MLAVLAFVLGLIAAILEFAKIHTSFALALFFVGFAALALHIALAGGIATAYTWRRTP